MLLLLSNEACLHNCMDQPAHCSDTWKCKITTHIRKVHFTQVDVNLLREREQNRQAEVEKHMAAQKALRDEVEAAQLKVEAAEDSQKAAEESLEDANEEIERLRKHVADLESRKRPPLYQRKQEEELLVRHYCW